MVSANNFYDKQTSVNFTIRNVATPKRTIRIFNYPIRWNTDYDLLSLPEISESYIRESLIKGELANKIRKNEILIVSSSIDLLQFDAEQKAFIEGALIGASNGIAPEKIIKNSDAPYIEFNATDSVVPPMSIYFDETGVANYTDMSGVSHSLGSGNVISGGEIFGNYSGDVICVGNVTISGNTIINGNLISLGIITNSGGYSLQVNGDLRCDELDWTPLNSSIAQSNIYIRGDFYFNVLDFPCNSGAVSLNVNGNCIGIVINGNGHERCNGLSINVRGDLNVREIYIGGGTSNILGAAGNGGNIEVYGSLYSYETMQLTGGSSSVEDENAGNGGEVVVAGSCHFNTLNVSGGGGEGANCGNGGNLYAKDCHFNNFIAVGGNCDSSDNTHKPGNGGNIICSSNVKAGSINVSAGNKTGITTSANLLLAKSNAGNVHINGDLHAYDIYGVGGSCNTTYANAAGGDGASVQIIGKLYVENILNINGGDSYGNNGGMSGACFSPSYIRCNLVNANGGSAFTSVGDSLIGSGGVSNTFQISGGCYIEILNMEDGATGTPITDYSAVLLNGTCNIKVLNVTDRTNRLIKPTGPDDTVTLCVFSMPGKTKLNNEVLAETIDISLYLNNSIFKFGDNAWYYIQGTTLMV